MRVRSLILAPENDIKVEDGPIKVSGIAWSGDGKVTKVELSFNEGQNWFKANLNPANSTYEMTKWEYVWNPNELGEFSIIARAFDSQGEKQPLNSRWNKGGYGNNVTHRIHLTIN